MKKFEPKKRQLSPDKAQRLLKEEIIELEKELEGQIVERSALEKAMNCHPILNDLTYKSLPKPAENLIKEIGTLEFEIVYLEKYLLSMYRRNFTKRVPNFVESPQTNDETHSLTSFEVAKANLASINDNSNNVLPLNCKDSLSGIYRSHSSLSHRSPRFEALDSYHSLPLSIFEQQKQGSASNASFRARETPNWISEEMIKCISTVYCHISDQDSSFVSHSPFNPWSNSPFHTEDSSESTFTIVEVKRILRDSKSLDSVQYLLQHYRFLVSKLAKIDPRTLKLEEKLAFWINVHNALVMHAYLVYGIPRGSLKRIALVLKAAYNIGGHTISIDNIQSSILRCRLPRPTQWLHTLFSPKTKFKSRDPRLEYAVNHSEPRLYFALSSGCQSDPLVRLYTPKKVFQDLEMAKEEHIQMNIKLYKEQRLLIPKNVEIFTKEMRLSPSGFQAMIEHSMPGSLINHFQQQKLSKKVDWVPHDFAFRFLLSNELMG